MAQDIRIPNPEEAKAVQAKQTAALNGLVEDVAKSVNALRAVDQNKIGNVATTAVSYSESMSQSLTQASEINADGQKKFKAFVEAVEEVENANFRL